MFIFPFLKKKRRNIRRKGGKPKQEEKERKVKPIVSISQIPRIVKNERLRLWICSYGGSGTNLLADYLSKKKKFQKTWIWKNSLCHFPHFINLGIPTIYIYDDPRKSFFSMKRRGKGYWDVNQRKLNNDNNTPLSDENLFKSMIQQWKEWVKHANEKNVLFLDFRHFFTEETKKKIQSFLKISIQDYPVYKPSNRKYDYSQYQDLFSKYENEIQEILQFYEKSKSPNQQELIEHVEQKNEN